MDTENPTSNTDSTSGHVSPLNMEEIKETSVSSTTELESVTRCNMKELFRKNVTSECTYILKILKDLGDEVTQVRNRKKVTSAEVLLKKAIQYAKSTSGNLGKVSETPYSQHSNMVIINETPLETTSKVGNGGKESRTDPSPKHKLQMVAITESNQTRGLDDNELIEEPDPNTNMDIINLFEKKNCKT